MHSGQDTVDKTTSHEAVTPLSEVVNSGQVSLDPATGEQLVKALTTQIDQADGWLARIAQLATTPPLGTNTVATAMSDKFERLATSDGISFESVMTAYRDVLTGTHAAVKKSLRDTTDNDDNASLRFGPTGDNDQVTTPKPFVPDINKI